MFNKSELRLIYKEKRQNFSTKKKEEFSKSIKDLFANSDFINLNCFHIFLPIIKQNEVNTWFIIEELFKFNKKIVVPKVEHNNLKHFILEKDTQIIPNKWKIPEPNQAKELINLSKIEVVFIPLLISDILGNRIGYGKGFYDKFLSELSENTIKIGLNFFPSIEKIENENHDIPLNYLISPFKIESFLANFKK